MVKKSIAIVVLLLMLSAAVYSDFDVKGGSDFYGMWAGDILGSNDVIYTASPYITALYSSRVFRAEVKVSADISSLSSFSFGFDKAWARVRIPTFGVNYLTVSAGRMPLSWGMGSYFRAGDTLFPEPITNSEIGGDADRNRWALTASQPLGGGFVVDAAFLPKLEETTGEIFGAMLKKTFSNKYLKEIRASYAYHRDGGTHRASVLADLALYFDIIIGVESSFESPDDMNILFDMKKAWSIDTDFGSEEIIGYVSSFFDLKEEEYDILLALSYSPTGRITLTGLYLNIIKPDNYDFIGMLTASLVPADGFEINIGAGILGLEKKYPLLYAGTEFSF